jgi:hypothetical protein
LSENEKLVQIFATEDKLNTRASKIAKEFGLNYIMKGIGNEFERIEEIKKLMLNLLFNFPVAYDVSPQSGQPNGIDRFTLLESGTYQS